ncbi:hypothetical protein [Nostoc sp. C110]|uniref:hypothetical protein n=1 Tax=Nostoc sp. C110 TaxID=3349876 RepID=UPI00370D2618
MRPTLFEQTKSIFIALLMRSPLKVLTVHILSDLAAIGYPNKPLMKSLCLVQIYVTVCLFAAP